MISLPRTAAAPAGPGGGRDSLSPAGRSGAPRISLRPSATLVVFPVVSLLVAAAALWTALAPWLGGWRAAPATLAFAAAAGLGAVAWCRRQPHSIEIGPDGVEAFARDGARLASGRLTGCAQWGGALLVLAVGVGRSRRTLLVAADAIAPEAFRELAVRGCCASGR
ncbi:hypothetical protein [Paraburkholderia caballeronis]|uniref:Uncharacterized protein n=1 Tax=Paraburkholderia caballeronis TaxID=416943 RepID=A0A1H7MK44_9BURK|nr:hypothetical protein [Paraburkholderia caballeronis]PXW26546.1 hypothetical protein C7403_104425 [Paraburkholderia caballeronis]PXX02093.1 hypothetical protein C7407_104425 [Paraburkholderia caballeronis]RAK01250.1 hypothetical protein C7409_104425 [Paraburkholderia caballeronis]TDV16185.1 hypothetical protein C7406_10839 [Paraburkholderia caballeronis]TDV20535.1 hypothetical protein C7408_10139 [Paraburkholderia caballeronis]